MPGFAQGAVTIPPHQVARDIGYEAHLIFNTAYDKFDERRLLLRLRDGSEVVASRGASELLRTWAR